MSTSSIHHRLAPAFLLLISLAPVAYPQSASSSLLTADSCKAPAAKPIKRVKAPAKPVAADWTTMASTYTHDAQGQRVDQYAAVIEPQSNERPDFVRSGYRHSRSTLQAGFSADHYHVTEQWGQPVQPYGQWRYPNRPFSVPYGQWGPQLPQVLGVGSLWGGPRWNAGPIFPINPAVGQPGAGNAVGPMLGPVGPNMPGPMNNGWNGNNALFNGPGYGSPNVGLGVGPWNTLPAGQDEYYQQAPSLRTPGSQPWGNNVQGPNIP